MLVPGGFQQRALPTVYGIKNDVFWDTTPRGSYKRRRFERTYSLHHHGERILLSVFQLLNTSNVVPSLLIHPDDGGRYVPLKHRLLQEPHGVTSQKTAIFILTAVRTSNFYIALTGRVL
jgi:hypothetical protein